jgi:hypothetical protein
MLSLIHGPHTMTCLRKIARLTVADKMLMLGTQGWALKAGQSHGIDVGRVRLSRQQA